MGVKRSRAARHNERGRELARRGESEAAIEEYEKAIEIDPEWAAPHYNIGLVYKYRGRWDLSLQANQKAVLLDPSDEAAWWNLGIAATAVGDWTEARRAWSACGIDLPPGEGPIDYPSGSTPIRLNPESEAEVVWSQRVDPARAVIRSIPFPESGFRWGDLVLNDGAPTGYRMLGDQEVPVFNCLGLLEPSQFSTCVADVRVLADTIADALPEIADSYNLAAEDWSTNVRMLCRACSEGRPHHVHEEVRFVAQGDHRVAVAARTLDEAQRVFDEWQRRIPSVEVLSVDLALEGVPGRKH